MPLVSWIRGNTLAGALIATLWLTGWATVASAQGTSSSQRAAQKTYVALLVRIEPVEHAEGLRPAIEKVANEVGVAIVAQGKVEARVNSTSGDPSRDSEAAEQLREMLGARSIISIAGVAIDDQTMKVQITSFTSAGDHVERWSGPSDRLVAEVPALVSKVMLRIPATDPTPAATAPIPVAPATQGWDVVVLQNGAVLYVRVLQQQPGSFVTVAYPNGQQQTFAWTEVRSVSVGQAPVAGGYPSQHHQSQSDTSYGRGGFGMSASGQTVERRFGPPPSYDIGFALEANFMYGKSTNDDVDLTLIGGGWLVGIRSMFGGQFPGPQGGSWSGVGIDATFHVQGGSGSVDAGGTETDFSQTTVAAGGQIGYQYLSFGQLDQADLKQPGFGVFLGARISYQWTEPEEGEGTSGSAYGPTLSLSFPKYNAGTTSLSRWTISALALYIEDFLLFSAGAGYTW